MLICLISSGSALGALIYLALIHGFHNAALDIVISVNFRFLPLFVSFSAALKMENAWDSWICFWCWSILAFIESKPRLTLQIDFVFGGNFIHYNHGLLFYLQGAGD